MTTSADSVGERQRDPGSRNADSVFDDVVDPGEANAFEDVSSNWLPFLHWLNLRHSDPDDEFWDLAHLVLSGGPDALWAGRFDLTPVMVYEDVQLLYASGRQSVTAEHVDQARRTKQVYYESAPKVADLVHRRKTREDYYDGPDRSGAGVVAGAMSEAYRERSLPVAVVGDVVPPVTDSDGGDMILSDKDLPQLKMSHQCSHILSIGRRCANRILPGNEFCSSHGGRLYTEEELRSIHQVTKQKLLGAAEQAVDNLIALFNSPNDMVRLKASEAILDRTGFVPGMEVTVIATAEGDKTSAQIIEERLRRLAVEPPQVEQVTPEASGTPDDDNVVDGEVVETSNNTSDDSPPPSGQPEQQDS